LTWLSEKKSAVFVVATANDVSMLPPELLRKGRFDEIFFVDLPVFRERKEVFEVHLSKRKMDTSNFDLDGLAQASAGYSGAEIEEAIISAMFNVFYEKQTLTSERLLESIRQTVPLSKTMSEDVDTLRKWAEGRARPATSAEVAAEAGEERRKLEI
jgi:SpoVK/Ycf46/Vps4 family AAA+-type ATPase